MTTAAGTEGQNTRAATSGHRTSGSHPPNPVGPPESGDVVGGVRADLAQIARADPELASGALAYSALVLARELDNAGNSATSKSMCCKALLDTMNRLWELTPTEEKGDDLDDLTGRRAARLAGRAAS